MTNNTDQGQDDTLTKGTKRRHKSSKVKAHITKDQFHSILSKASQPIRKSEKERP
jgi:hypothetical protein